MILSGYLVMYIDYTYMFFLSIYIYRNTYIWDHIYIIISSSSLAKSPLSVCISSPSIASQKTTGDAPWAHEAISAAVSSVFSVLQNRAELGQRCGHIKQYWLGPDTLGGQTAWGQQPCKTDGTKIDSRSWFTRWSFQMFLCSPPPGEMLC